jgi:hypothetical protein
MIHAAPTIAAPAIRIWFPVEKGIETPLDSRGYTRYWQVVKELRRGCSCGTSKIPACRGVALGGVLVVKAFDFA